MITKIIEFEAAAGQEVALLSLLKGMVEPSRAEKGCLKYDLYTESENAAKLIIIESWATAEDLEAHRQAEHMAHFKANCGPLIASKAGRSLDCH